MGLAIGERGPPGRGSIMRRFIVPGVFFVLNFFNLNGAAFAAALAMSVTQEASEEQRIADVLENYAPLATFSGSEKMVFVVPEASAIKVLEDARGKRLGLPSADSLAAYLALGEFNSKGLQLKSYFQQIRNYSSHEIALYALEMGAVDVAVAAYRVAEKWLSKNKRRVLQGTKSVPSLGIALNATLDQAMRRKIRDALLSPNPKSPAVA